MKTTITQIGNSQGVRIPKSLLEQCNLELSQEVILSVQDKQLVISQQHPRLNWDKQFAAKTDNVETQATKDFETIDIQEIDDWQW